MNYVKYKFPANSIFGFTFDSISYIKINLQYYLSKDVNYKTRMKKV